MEVIETEYNGFRFRSRLEARWAVFMDAMRVPYQYEPEAFVLDGLFYLPDFWLPQTNSYLEIKPERPSAEEMEKAYRLAKFTERRVHIMFGQPESPEVGSSESAYLFVWMHDQEGDHPGWDCFHWWCECPRCGRCEIQFNGRADRIACKCPKSPHGDKGYNYESENLIAAYTQARRYRFEPRANNWV